MKGDTIQFSSACWTNMEVSNIWNSSLMYSCAPVLRQRKFCHILEMTNVIRWPQLEIGKQTAQQFSTSALEVMQELLWSETHWQMVASNYYALVTWNSVQSCRSNHANNWETQCGYQGKKCKHRLNAALFNYWIVKTVNSTLSPQYLQFSQIWVTTAIFL